jgi:hypothetical protein
MTENILIALVILDVGGLLLFGVLLLIRLILSSKEK